MKLRCDFRAAVLMKNRLHHESGEQIIQINKDDGIHLQAHLGGISLDGIGSELIIFLFFVTVGFVYSRWRSIVTDGWFGQMHLTDKNHSCTCHHMFERVLFSFLVFFHTLSCLYFLSHCLLVLCSAHQLRCCRNRRGKTTALTHNEEVVPCGDTQPSQKNNAYVLTK